MGASPRKKRALASLKGMNPTRLAPMTENVRSLLHSVLPGLFDCARRIGVIGESGGNVIQSQQFGDPTRQCSHATEVDSRSGPRAHR